MHAPLIVRATKTHAALSADLERTISAMADGFVVGQIASAPVYTTSPSERSSPVRFDGEEYDFLPVRKGDEVTGVYSPSNDEEYDLNQAWVVSAERSLLKWLDELSRSIARPDGQTHGEGPRNLDPVFSLVSWRETIVGVVTSSDLQRLPVRTLLFSLITHFELAMMEAIHTITDGDDDQWLPLLSDSRREKLFQERDALRANRMDLPLLEITQFCDKRDVLARLVDGLGTRFKKDVERIERIRNLVAHASSFAKEQVQAMELLKTLNILRDRIATLHGILGVEGVVGFVPGPSED